MTMKKVKAAVVSRLALVVAMIAIALPASGSQDGRKKPIAFSGRVESVDLQMRTVAVRHGVIPGFMPAMTLDYMIDNDDLLKQLSPADDITATVYVGDPTLHNVHVVGHSSSGQRR